MNADDVHRAVERFLRGPTGRIAMVLVSTAIALYAFVVGDDVLVFLVVLFVFILVTDGVSSYAWTRLDSYFERRERAAAAAGGPERELTPHGLSRTSKIVIVVGTVLFGLYVLFAMLLVLVYG